MFQSREGVAIGRDFTAWDARDSPLPTVGTGGTCLTDKARGTNANSKLTF